MRKLKVIWHYASKFKLKFSLLYGCIIATTLIAVTYPYLFGKLVDEVFYNRNKEVFIQIVIIYGILFAVEQSLHFVLNLTWAQLMTRFLFEIRQSLFEKILTLKATYLSEIHTGDLIKRINKDTEEFMNFIHHNVLYASAHAVNLILSIIIIINLNWMVGLLVLIMTPIIVYITNWYSKKAKKFYKQVSKDTGLLNSWTYEILKGKQEITLLGARKSVIKHFASKMKHIIKFQVKSKKIELSSERINTGIALITRLIMYSVSAYFIIKGQFTVGGFIASISYFEKITQLFTKLTKKWVSIQNNMVGVERIMEILDEESERTDGQSVDITEGHIVFKDVAFSYNQDKQVLDQINLDIKGGTQVALVGESGSGKSTIAQLLLGFYTVDKGEIYIDGQPVSRMNLKDLRRKVGIVWQEAFLVDGTLRENLLIANRKATDEEIMKCLIQANCEEFVRRLPNKLDTLIGKNGYSLSGGEKQRISIARILLQNPKILILDEATSALDFESEKAVKAAWEKLKEGRTQIIIAHRLSTIKDCANVFVLDKGVIAGKGAHYELLGKCEVYDRLYAGQYISG